MRNTILTTLLAAWLASTASGQLTGKSQNRFVAALRLSEEIASKADHLKTGESANSAVAKVVFLLSNTYETEVHRMQGQKENETYLHKDGKQEAVYDKNGKLVKDGINDGSYNYYHPKKDSLRHLTFDMAPWIMLGASRKDPTSLKERVHAYSAEIFAAISRIRKDGKSEGEEHESTLEKLGEAEAAAMILMAIEKGSADNFLKALDSNHDLTDDQLIKLVNAFESGLLSLLKDTNAKKPNRRVITK